MTEKLWDAKILEVLAPQGQGKLTHRSDTHERPIRHIPSDMDDTQGRRYQPCTSDD